MNRPCDNPARYRRFLYRKELARRVDRAITDFLYKHFKLCGLDIYRFLRNPPNFIRHKFWDYMKRKEVELRKCRLQRLERRIAKFK